REMFALPDFKVVRGMSPQADREWHVFTNSLSDVVTGFDDPDLRRLLAETMRQATSPRGLFAYYGASEGIDVTSLLGAIEAPTLVIYDTSFPFGSFELCRDVAARIKNSEFVVLDGRFITGHEQQPYLDSLTAFLRGGAEVRVMEPEPKRPGGELTRREIDVLRLIASGLTNDEIATQLTLSERTVARHITNIYAKINVRTKAGATAYALRHGIT
ncbi:MAG TPA: response regulator transcription factor, partial [Gammaproteobacteria bacterium]|nr:response regulator transcription factor [Gammaproteobacteria bacterium]